MYRLINTFINSASRHSSVLIQAPWPRSFGNCVEEIRYGLLKAQREGKRTLFLLHRHELWGRLRVPIANREVFLLESEHMVPSTSVRGRVGGWLLTGIYGLIRPFDLLWRSEKVRRAVARIVPFANVSPTAPDMGASTMPEIGLSRLWQTDEARTFSWDVVTKLNWTEQYARYQPPRLAEAKRRSAERVRLEMGVSLTDWFVALHVREWGGSTSINYRNSSIHNYLDAIRFITQAGGWVIRLGDASMTPLPVMERVVDYAHSRWKSELMDLYLISECRFYLGTNSGPIDVALLFGRPLLSVNCTDLAFWGPMGPGDLGILKHVFSRRLRRVLSVSEVLEEPFESNCVSTLSDSQDYALIENSPDEIRDVVEEFLQPVRPPTSDLQLAFNVARNRAIHRWLDGGDPKRIVDRERHATEQYRIAARADVPAGTLGQKYLEQNWNTVPPWLTEFAGAMRAPTVATAVTDAGDVPNHRRQYVELEG